MSRFPEKSRRIAPPYSTSIALGDPLRLKRFSLRSSPKVLNIFIIEHIGHNNGCSFQLKSLIIIDNPTRISQINDWCHRSGDRLIK